MQQFFYEYGADTIWHLQTGHGFNVIDLSREAEALPLPDHLHLYGSCGKQHWLFQAPSKDTTEDMLRSAVTWYSQYCDKGSIKITTLDPRVL